VKDIVAQSQMEMGWPCSKNEPAQMGSGYITVGRNDGQKETG